MAAPLSASRPGRAPAAVPKRVRILMVDDEPKNLLALEAVLGDLDHDLVKAGSGKEALRWLMKDDFAVILLDVQMPEMDGFETAALIRARDRTRYTPIIFLTAVGKTQEEMFRGYEVGAVDYLLKPFAPEILRYKVSVLVDLHLKTEQVRALNVELQRYVGELEDSNARLDTENQERRRAEESLRSSEERLSRLNSELEERVRARTAELEQRDDELTRSNQELAQYAAVVSHDLQEPLRTMSSYLQLLEQDLGPELKPADRMTLDVVLASLRRMRQLIADILSFSKVGAGPRTPQDVESRELVQQALEQLGGLIQSTGAVVELGELPRLRAEPGLLTQVFQNLVSNALKFSRTGSARVEIGAAHQGPNWRFWVKDNGIGIDPVNFDKLFRLFRRLHTQDEYPGSGLGLSICKKIVERHGGRIWVDSRPGEGSTFFFTIPAEEGAL
jgi:signal transduction histidine kinase